jgi:hypothetical protein
MMSGVPDLALTRQYGVPQSSVQRHRTLHLLKVARNRLAILAKSGEEERKRRELAKAAAAPDEPPIQQLIEARVGTRALLRKKAVIDARLERMSARAEEAGSPTGVAALAGQQLRGLEFDAKLGGHHGFVPQAALPQASERIVHSINYIFQGAGKTESFGITDRPLIDGDKVDPTATDGMDVPSPHPKTKVTRDPEGKTVVPYWGYEKLPDKLADDTEDN